MKTDFEIIHSTYHKIIKYWDQLGEDERNHLFWMLEQIMDEEYTNINDIRKVNRWVGFVHGQLVAYTDCTVDELRALCR